MLYLIVGEDEQYTKDNVNPEELKAAANGSIKIFQIEPLLNEKFMISVYCPIEDNFETELPKRYE